MGPLFTNAAYLELEKEMRKLAKDDGDVFHPNVEPVCPVQYVLIGMEPSLGRKTQGVAWSFRDGARNFLPGEEVALLHFCIRQYLCRPGERYHITDVSKGAMLPHHAGLTRAKRWDRWYPLLQKEIDLVATPNAGIVAIGKTVFRYLKPKTFPNKTLHSIIHYSNIAIHGRRVWIEQRGLEDDFEAFRDSVSLDDVVATAEDVLTSGRVPANLCDETLSRLRNFRLTIPRQRLIFIYKVAFESMRSQRNPSGG